MPGGHNSTVEAWPDATVHRDKEAGIIENLEQVLLRDLAASSFQLRQRIGHAAHVLCTPRSARTPLSHSFAPAQRASAAHLGIIGENKVGRKANLRRVESHVQNLILAEHPASHQWQDGVAHSGIVMNNNDKWRTGMSGSAAIALTAPSSSTTGQPMNAPAPPLPPACRVAPHRRRRTSRPP